jgi:tetratricopeptide (TPR) repeat protein
MESQIETASTRTGTRTAEESRARAAALLARAVQFEKQGREEDALQHIRQALELPEIDSRTWRTAGDLAHLCGDIETAERCWRRLADLEPWEPRWAFRLAIAAEERADYQTACHVLASARERWPTDPMLELLRVRYAAFDEASRLSGEETAALAADPRTNPSIVLNAARKLLAMRRIDAGRAALSRLSNLPNDTDIAQAAKVELKCMEIIERTDPALLAAIPGELGVGNEAVFHRAEGAQTTLIVFGGLGGRVGVTVNVFHAIVAPLGVNAIYLFDSDRLFHLRGNRVLGHDYAGALEGLRRLLADWHSTRVVSIGNSGGGYGALRYGLDLGAERVLGFSAPTIMSEDFLLRYDRRARATVKRFNRLVPDMAVDLRPLLERAPAAPRIDLYFGSDMPQDRMHAERLQGLPSVNLHPVERVGRHDVAGALLLEGRLAAILEEACRDAPAAAPVGERAEP